MWPFTRHRERGNKVSLEEARRARLAAEMRLAVAEREIVVPLRRMHQENHIQPLVRALIQRKAEERDSEG